MMRRDLPEAICNTYLINILNRRNFRPLKLLIKNRWTTYIAAVNRIASGVWNSRGRDNEYLVWRMNSNETALSINYAIHSPLLKFPSVSLNAPKLANVEDAAGITKSFYWRHRPNWTLCLRVNGPIHAIRFYAFIRLIKPIETRLYFFMLLASLKTPLKVVFLRKRWFAAREFFFFLTTRANLSRVWRRR